MFAICSVSPHVNGVRKHVRTMKENGWKYRVIQIPTNDYRRLHQIMNQGESMRLMDEIQAIEDTHIIDIDNLTIHAADCADAPEECVPAAIEDLTTHGLTECACMNK